MEQARKYLDAYRNQLGAVQTTVDLYDRLYRWHWEQIESGNAAHTQQMINRVLLGEGNEDKWLEPAQPPTTAIGGLEGLVIVSANPHYDAERNAREQSIRCSRQGNRKFCESFFANDNWEVTQEIDWWKRAARFGYHALEGRDHRLCVNDLWRNVRDKKAKNRTILGINHLWTWAHDSKKIGVVDLVPFHSRSDGITGLIIPGPNDNKLEKGKKAMKLALHAAALETFRMVLRLRPQVVVVASKAGAVIADEILRKPNSGFGQCEDVICTITEDSDWKHAHQYHLHHFVSRYDPGQSATHVLTIPNQLFSNQAGLGKVRTKVLPNAIYRTIVNTQKSEPRNPRHSHIM